MLEKTDLEVSALAVLDDPATPSGISINNLLLMAKERMKGVEGNEIARKIQKKERHKKGDLAIIKLLCVNENRVSRGLILKLFDRQDLLFKDDIKNRRVKIKVITVSACDNEEEKKETQMVKVSHIDGDLLSRIVSNVRDNAEKQNKVLIQWERIETEVDRVSAPGDSIIDAAEQLGLFASNVETG